MEEDKSPSEANQESLHVEVNKGVLRSIHETLSMLVAANSAGGLDRVPPGESVYLKGKAWQWGALVDILTQLRSLDYSPDELRERTQSKLRQLIEATSAYDQASLEFAKASSEYVKVLSGLTDWAADNSVGMLSLSHKLTGMTQMLVNVAFHTHEQTHGLLQFAADIDASLELRNRDITRALQKAYNDLNNIKPRDN